MYFQKVELLFVTGIGDAVLSSSAKISIYPIIISGISRYNILIKDNKIRRLTALDEYIATFFAGRDGRRY